ncbi:hypothetical protein LEMLEM_LOCUS15838 [Lemmus lemmus]
MKEPVARPDSGKILDPKNKNSQTQEEDRRECFHQRSNVHNLRGGK